MYLSHVSFWLCTPYPPTPVSILAPENTTNYTISTPITLRWNVSDSGQPCDFSDIVYRIYLSESFPPSYLMETSNTFLKIDTLNNGVWYWNVMSSNSRFSVSSDYSVFQVSIFCSSFFNL